MTAESAPAIHRREAGILLHPTSLPGPFDLGVLGADARRFVDLLESAGCRIWQTLPLGPVDRHLSPYMSSSTFAFNTRLIDFDSLSGLKWGPTDDEISASRKWIGRESVLDVIADRFDRWADPGEQEELATFIRTEHEWLTPFCLFRAITLKHGGRPWQEWPLPLRHRDNTALEEIHQTDSGTLRRIRFEQFLARRQWNHLKEYANRRGIAVFGDVPFYVAMNSADVWWHRDLFEVDEDGAARNVAGVPPDYFSEDGQLWGNPLYNWAAIERHDYRWWRQRIGVQCRLFDRLRIDHFRAIESYWAVSGPTAREGEWRTGPGDGLLAAVCEAAGPDTIVAEDLGMITTEVRALRDRFELPGMLVLQFAFDGSADNPFLPRNHVENAVAYTGTHDNDTTLGWYRTLDEATRQYVGGVLGNPQPGMPDALIDATLSSPARMAILPMQDLLGLGPAARMNRPGTPEGNWAWRFDWAQVPAGLGARLGRQLAQARRIAADAAGA